MLGDSKWLVAVDPDRHSLRLTGEFDIANVDVVRAAASSAGMPGEEVLVDLADVGFCSAALLGCLIALRSEHAVSGGAVRLVAISPVVQRVLDITDTAALFGPGTAAPRSPTRSGPAVGVS